MNDTTRAPMLRSARAELLRLGRWPVTWVLVGVWTILNLIFVYVFNWISYRGGDGPPTGPGESLLPDMLPAAVPQVLVQGMPMFGGAIVMILGALAVGSGYGWGTWKTALTQGPGRAAAFGGMLMALAVAVVGIVVLTAAVDLGVSSLVAVVEGQSSDLPAWGDLLQSIGAGVLLMGMWTAAGVVVGAVTLGPALAVGLGLVWSLVLENLLRGVSGLIDGMSAVTDHLPGSAAGSLGGSGVDAEGNGTPGVLDILTASTASWWLAGYLLVFVALATVLVRRRDLA
ncbi:MAG: ABC transporter permease [Jiangellaceae bacterium]